MVILCLLLGGTGAASTAEDLPFYRPVGKSLPGAVASWKKSCLRFDMVASAFSLVRNGRTYVFVSAGVKPAGGYGVRVSRIDRALIGAITVYATFSLPARKGDRNRERPYDLVAVCDTARTVTVIPEGRAAPPRIARLAGAQELPPVVNESRAIKLFSPRPGEAVGRTFQIFGAALVFEGTVQVRLTTTSGNLLARTFISAASALDWGCFRMELTVPDSLHPLTRMRLELFTTDEEKGGMKDIVRTSLILR